MSATGDRGRVRLRDVARATRVSVKTVSRVLNDEPWVAPVTRARVAAALHQSGYVPNGIARGLRLRRTHAIGLLIADIRNPFYSELARAVEAAARPGGFHLLLGNTDEDTDRQSEYLRLFQHQRVDGLIVVPAGGEEELARLSRHVPTVMVDRPVPGALADTVLIDNAAAASWLVTHLVGDHGVRTVVAVGGDPAIHTIGERLDAYHRAMRQHGLTPHLTLGHLTAEQAQSGAEMLLGRLRPPIGCFATNGRMLLGALGAARALGLTVPGELAVVGVDELQDAPALGTAPTCMVQPVAELGARCAAFLLSRMADPGRDPVTVVLPCRPVVGTTCGCTRAARAEAAGRRLATAATVPAVADT